jgi:L-alanine-DL-glutamate epimerase-like enolase superfamily enzyme
LPHGVLACTVGVMTFTIQRFRFHVLPMRLRFPFKYGIASMTVVPHVFVNVDLVVNGREVSGLSSEGLALKWFTKNPETPFEADLCEMIAVIQNASRIARLAAERPVGFFAWWQDLYAEQANWAKVREVPPLLANLGVSLMERAVLDGICKALGRPLHAVLGSEELGIDLSAVRGVKVGKALAERPLERVHVRHTIGLGDELRASEIPAAERVNDGLPQALDESIRAYGLSFFKIKICGKAETDLPRLREVTRILVENCPRGFKTTLDGNEQFHALASFRDYYAMLRAEKALEPLFEQLLLIEQPLHRAKALGDEMAVLREWKDMPGMIIDESDGSLDDLPRALELGYRGTSHKNCKGIVKGLANAALLRTRPDSILSGEDLCSIGPVAMLQDVAVQAALGVAHVERNGHHYFRGLDVYPEALQGDVLAAHDGFYQRHAAGFPMLRIEEGQMDVTSVNAAPFGCGAILSMEPYEALDAWIKRGGLGEL